MPSSSITQSVPPHLCHQPGKKPFFLFFSIFSREEQKEFLEQMHLFKSPWLGS